MSADHSKSPQLSLPTFVDTIIIGSGISGALIAHNLLQRDHGGSSKSLLMLEARELASGATGRNGEVASNTLECLTDKIPLGGHIKPDCYKNFNELSKTVGREVAKIQCRFEMENLIETVSFIKEQGLADEVDLIETRATDVYMNKKAWEAALDSYQNLRRAAGEQPHIRVLSGIEAQQVYYDGNRINENTSNKYQESRVLDAHGAITFPACSLWPYKLTVGIVRKCLNQGLQLLCHTPVLHISARSPDGMYTVSTSRGTIRCSTIFHATNGYASHLLPELSSKVVPVKGHVVAIKPSAHYESTPLETTYGIQWGDDFDYLIQRQSDGKPLIYGGGDLAHKHKLLGPLGDYDDSKLDWNIIRNLQGFPSKHFEGWGAETTTAFSWSGVMGFTPDLLPLVGEIPNRPKQFMAVGYNGHGKSEC